MPSADDRPAVYAVGGGVLSLSGPAVKEFLRAVLARGVPFRFCARGMSMDPFIRDGDVITVAPLDALRPRLGEVVACCHPRDGHLIVHRVVACDCAGVVLRGDASDVADGAVAWSDVLGRVSAVHREGRRVVIGGGPERVPLAHLSRRGLLHPVIWHSRRALSRAREAFARTGVTSGRVKRG